MSGDQVPQFSQDPADRPSTVSAPELDALAEYLRARGDELEMLEREVHELRRQLRAIHTSNAWAFLNTLTQTREALAPRGTQRDRLARATLAGLRRLKRSARDLAAAARARRAAWSGVHVPVDPSAYAVVCLPIIEWSFRFQRPQQIMRRFARRGHRVYYAANHFHGGTSARLRPVEPNVFEMILPGDPTVNVYHRLPAEPDIERMLGALARLRAEQRLTDGVIIVQLPFWGVLAERLRNAFGWTLVYDCMDDHAGFHNNTEDVLRGEAHLIALADLVVTSSDRLHQAVGSQARKAVLVRNGCEFGAFSTVVASEPGRPCGLGTKVGYYGAIAEWFDGDLVAGLARLRPDWEFELIGSTLHGDTSMLEPLPNIRMLGERPYVDLPRLIDGWDAYIIPFKRVPLTEATNPVKVYEMLATGKPVVSVALPELVPLAERGLVALAHDPASFTRELERAVADTDSARPAARRAFARENTWETRQAALARAINEIRTARVRLDGPGPLAAPHVTTPVQRTRTA